MYFERNAKTPHFSFEEIQQIYEVAKHKDTKTMQETARSLFPNRDPITYENISIWEGPGRSFKHTSGDYEKPKYMIMAHPVLIGVMKDGTMYLF